MDGPEGGALRIGGWRVDAVSSVISRNGESARVDARLMRLLMCLADRAGQVVTTDELLQEVWSGVVVTQDSVYQAVASLRRLLGDDPKSPTYIATVPRQGYRLVAAVGAWTNAPPIVPAQAAKHAAQANIGTLAPALSAKRATRARIAILLTVGAALCLVQAASVGPAHAPGAASAPPQNSIAILPFLDLTTQSMDQEYFADGLTEELIDQLSKSPDLKVPSATAAFYFKGKQETVAQIARELGVAYVVDGSLRKSGSTLRVAARLMRAENGFVVWSRTFDRQSDDVLKIQDDVAVEVTKELRATLQALSRGAGNVR